jgi:hydrogenase-4 component B
LRWRSSAFDSAVLELQLIASAIALVVTGGALALVLAESFAPKLLAIVCCTASLLALASGAGTLAGGSAGDATFWTLPVLGPVTAGTSSLGALFICIAALVLFPVSLYSMAYLDRFNGVYSRRAFTAWYCVLVAATYALLVCRDVMSFFVVWEVIAIACAALVAHEWQRESSARAAFVMLATSEAGTLAAIVAMLLTRAGSGSLLFGAAPLQLSAPLAWLVFLLSFFGFGVKAGLLPMNSWLPRAYCVAPGSVSAVLSGAVAVIGVYGILLVNLQLAPVQFAAQGAIVMIVGVASALIGILYATVEDDLKTMLAYSSIENLGIVFIGLGAAFVFAARHQPLVAAIGFAASIYHLLNHSSYKSLLFLGAATIDAKIGVRSMNRLGGVVRVLPATAGLFLIGTLSIAAIPPFNGFASEWLTFQSLLRSATSSSSVLRAVFALCGAGLALTTALAVTCFVKAYGMTFLGRSREPLPQVGQTSATMRLAMVVLAAECVLLGVLPTYVLPAIGRGGSSIFGDAVMRALVPSFFHPFAGPHPLPADFIATFHALGAQIGSLLPGGGWVVMLRGGPRNPVVFAMSTTYFALIVAVLLALAYGIVRFFARSRRTVRSAAWSGGLRHVPSELTYTATAFSNPVRVIFNAIFHPTEVENERETIHEHFRSAIRRRREEVFLADRTLTLPIAHATYWLASLLARIHHGRLPAYAGYALFTLILALSIGTHIWSIFEPMIRHFAP